jgi:hypothetical protein
MASNDNPEQFLDVSFPEQGIDTASEFRAQKPLTTPYAVNVRLKEPVGGMKRGGQRKGLIRYIDDQLEDGSLIQHLNMVVDPQAPGLTASDELWDVTNGVLDPSTNVLRDRNPGDRYLPPTGSGRRPNINVPTDNPGEGVISFVQAKHTSHGNSTSATPRSTVLDTAPESTTSLVIAICMQTDDSAGGYGDIDTVENAVGGSYTRLGGIGYDVRWNWTPTPNPSASFFNFSVWYRRTSTAAVDEQTVVVTPAGADAKTLNVILLEYRNCDTTSPVFDFDQATGTAGTGQTMTAGTVTPNNTSGELVLGLFWRHNAAKTAGTDYTERVGNLGVSGIAASMLVEEKAGVSGLVPISPDATVDFGVPGDTNEYGALSLVLIR